MLKSNLDRRCSTSDGQGTDLFLKDILGTRSVNNLDDLGRHLRNGGRSFSTRSIYKAIVGKSTLVTHEVDLATVGRDEVGSGLCARDGSNAQRRLRRVSSAIDWRGVCRVRGGWFEHLLRFESTVFEAYTRTHEDRAVRLNDGNGDQRKEGSFLHLLDGGVVTEEGHRVLLGLEDGQHSLDQRLVVVHANVSLERSITAVALRSNVDSPVRIIEQSIHGVTTGVEAELLDLASREQLVDSTGSGNIRVVREDVLVLEKQTGNFLADAEHHDVQSTIDILAGRAINIIGNIDKVVVASSRPKDEARTFRKVFLQELALQRNKNNGTKSKLNGRNEVKNIYYHTSS